jgi:hypothetical protein
MAANAGFFPYMSKYVLSILADSNNPPMIVNTNTVMLATSSQAATLVTPNLKITCTGAVNGKILKTTQTGLSGMAQSKAVNQSGEMAISTDAVTSCWASRILE